MPRTYEHEQDITNEHLVYVCAAIHKLGNAKRAAKALNMDYSKVCRRQRLAAARGLLGTAPVLPGFEITSSTTKTDENGGAATTWVTQKPAASEEKFVIPAGMALTGISALTDSDGRVKQSWQIAREDKELAHLKLVDYLKHAFDDYETSHVAHPLPDGIGANWNPNHLNLYPCNDWHINLLCWEREVGENWDLKIAERVIGETVDEVMYRSPNCPVGIVLGGGDLLHNDDNTNRTAKSGNMLDADGRHQKGLQAAERLMVRTIDRALEKHDNVIVRNLKGNHDEYSAVTVSHFLGAYYRNDPRVVVDLSDSLFWYRQFGKVMLCAAHGHTIKMDQFYGIAASRQPIMWGSTLHRYAHFFHIHHASKVASEGNGIITESHQAPVPKDGWHHGAGYISGRSIQSITYHSEYGERGRVREAILDAGPN